MTTPIDPDNPFNAESSFDGEKRIRITWGSYVVTDTESDLDSPFRAEDFKMKTYEIIDPRTKHDSLMAEKANARFRELLKECPTAYGDAGGEWNTWPGCAEVGFTRKAKL